MEGLIQTIFLTFSAISEDFVAWCLLEIVN